MSWGRLLKVGISWGLEPLEGEFAVVDPFDDGEPEALEFPLLVPVGGQDPRADPQGLSGGGAVRLADRRRRQGCTSLSRRGRTRSAYVHVLF